MGGRESFGLLLDAATRQVLPAIGAAQAHRDLVFLITHSPL